MALPQQTPPSGQPQGVAILQDITLSLQLPWIPHSFIALNDQVPRYLELAWRQLGPIVITTQFAEQARATEQLAESTTRSMYRSGYQASDLRQLGIGLSEISIIRTALAALRFGWSQTLTMMELLRRALDGPPVGQPHGISWPREATTWATAIIPITDEKSASETVRRILQDARQTLGLAEPPESLLAIGKWPDYLNLAWADLTSVVQSAAFASTRGMLAEEARQQMESLPGWVDLSAAQLQAAGLNPIEIQRVREILDRWAFRLPTEIILASCLRYPLVNPASMP